MPTVHVLQGPDKGRTYQTPNEPAVIGRHSDHIQLKDHGVSRRHAELRPDHGQWFLLDLNSSNGTYLNGRRIVSPTLVHHGDQIRVGSTLMVFDGNESFNGFGRPGTSAADLVDLGSEGVDSSILTAIGASDESVILQPPETADAVAAWNIVYKVAELLGHVESVDLFLERVADIVFDHMVVDRMVVLVHDPRAEKLIPRVVRHRHQKGDAAQRKITTSQTIINHVLHTREGVLCANAMTDRRFSAENSSDSIHRFGLRSVICVPILAHDAVYGVIHLDCSMSHHTYTQEQLRLAVSIGRLIGMAIENQRFLETRMRTERLAATGETVAYLSHHIRNILQGLQSGAEVVELGIRKESLDNVRSGWDIVRRNLDRIFLLTVNMLTFSKERRPRIEPVQVNRLIDDVLELCQRRADEKAVVLLAEQEDLPPIPLDPEGMHQVLQNIVINAIDASPTGEGRVVIRSSYDLARGEVAVSISDNGPGIAPDERERIFEAFHSQKGHGGTGLGLAAARKIIMELSGQIDVQSEPGEGTTFHVHIPVRPAPRDESDKTHGPVR